MMQFFRYQPPMSSSIFLQTKLCIYIRLFLVSCERKIANRVYVLFLCAFLDARKVFNITVMMTIEIFGESQIKCVPITAYYIICRPFEMNTISNFHFMCSCELQIYKFVPQRIQLLWHLIWIQCVEKKKFFWLFSLLFLFCPSQMHTSSLFPG